MKRLLPKILVIGVLGCCVPCAADENKKNASTGAQFEKKEKTILEEEEVESGNDSRLQNLSMITGFHLLNNSKQKFSIRLLEADGSATVAENPVYLFVVVVHWPVDGPETFRSWSLPISFQVAEVKKVRPIKDGIRIWATQDKCTEEAVEAGGDKMIIEATFVREGKEIGPKLRLKKYGR